MQVRRSSISQARSEETKTESTLSQALSVDQAGKLGWRWVAGVVAFYSLLTTIMTWPLVLNFGNAVPQGDIEDRYQNFWNFWWVKWALEHFQNPYHSTLLYYPYYTGPGPFSQGNNLPLYFHDLQLLNALLVLPLTVISGVAAAYNGLIFGSFVASGVGACLLARYLVKNTPAALLAGTVYAFAAIRFEAIQGSWTNILATQWLPFYILALHLWYDRRQWRYLLGAIVCITACAYTDWYNTTYLALYTLFFFIVISWPFSRNPQSGSQSPKWLRWWKALKVLLPVAIGALVLSAPLLIPSFLELKNPLFVTVYGIDKDYRDSTLLSELANPFSPHGVALWLALVFGGLILLWRRGKANWRSLLYWLAFGLICFVLALGPKLQWERVRGGEPGGPYLPYYLFKKLPAAQVMHSPNRFEIPGSLGFGLALAFAVAALSMVANNQLPRLRLRGISVALGAALPSLLLGGLTLVAVNEAPLKLQPLERYAFVDTLLKDNSDYRLLELPITRHNNFDYTRMYSQIIHEHPITGGYISRPILDPYRDQASPFRYLSDQLYLYGDDPTKDIFPASYSYAVFDNIIKLNHFDYTVIYKEDYKKPEEIEQVRALLDSHLGKASLVQEDARTLTYKTPPEFWQKSVRPGLLLGDGLYGVEQNTTGRYRWTQPTAHFYLTMPKGGKVKLRLTLAAFGGDHNLRLLLDGQEVFKGQITPAPKAVEVEFEAKVGTNSLSLETPDPVATPLELNQGNDNRKLAFLVQNISVENAG